MALHPLTVAPVDALDDPRLDDYRDIRDDRLRERGNAFAVESREVVRRLLCERRFHLRSVLTTARALETIHDLLDDTTAVYLAGNELIRSVIGFNFHRGCMGIAERGVPLGLDALLAPTPRTLVVCEMLSNPDNVGSVFRNAMAFGAGGVVLSPGCADPLSRKVVRVSMGSSTHVPFTVVAEWPGALERLRSAGLTIVALTPRDGNDLSTLIPPARSALLLGSEGDGLSEAALAHADRRATIRMVADVDSINVAVACGIALHRLASSEG